MNHNHRKPYIPLPPALPRFDLPNEEREEAIDPLDAAATSQRPALTSGRRRVVRRVRPTPIKPDATEEVQVEDILLEAYAEDPPPPMTRRSPSLPASESIAAAIASVVPPPPVQSAAVDALLRASDPAFLPQVPLYPPQGQGYIHVAYGSGPDFESPSVAPVMLATTTPPPMGSMVARPIVRTARKSRGLVLALWSVALLVLGVAAGAGIMVGIRNGTFEHLRNRAASIAKRGDAKPAPVAAAAPAEAPAAVEAPVVAPSSPALAASAEPAPAPVSSVSVDSLPKSSIGPEVALVTLPAYAQGHRVFLDGRIVAVADGTPMKMKCGRHMLKIGSLRRARVVDLACGRDVVVTP